MMKAPDRIYLQIDPDGEGAFYQIDETTWCQDKINDNDVEYIRADLVKQEVQND